MTGIFKINNNEVFGSDGTFSGTIGSGANLNSATFPAGTVVGYEKNQTVISSAQSGTETYTDITGSSITYTPTTGASYIVYECSFVESANGSSVNPLFGFRFLVDGSITKNQDSYSPYMDGVGPAYSGIKKIHRMIYSASGWTTNKVVKMQFRIFSSTGNGGDLHRHYYDYLSSDGSEMGTDDRLTDVDVTIYSVM